MMQKLSLLLLFVLFLVFPVAADQIQVTPFDDTFGHGVHVVLYWQKNCVHCERIADQVLPGLQQQYGTALKLHLVELRTPADWEPLFKLTDAAGLPRDKVGTPTVVIGDHLLVGDEPIATRLGSLIQTYEAAGGAPMPSLEGKPLVTSEQEGVCGSGTPCDEAAAIQPPAAAAPAVDHAKRDGLWLAAAVLITLLILLVIACFRLARALRRPAAPGVAAAIMAAIGLTISSYLAWTYLHDQSTVCGPVGNCAEVQLSPYSRLFGVLPLPLLGMAVYVALLAVWAAVRFGRGSFARLASSAFLLTALAGLLFSIYLTYLELFVIRAVCMWCLGSATIMGVLLMLSVTGGRPLQRRDSGSQGPQALAHRPWEPAEESTAGE